MGGGREGWSDARRSDDDAVEVLVKGHDGLHVRVRPAPLAGAGRGGGVGGGGVDGEGRGARVAPADRWVKKKKDGKRVVEWVSGCGAMGQPILGEADELLGGGATTILQLSVPVHHHSCSCVYWFCSRIRNIYIPGMPSFLF